MGRSESGRRDHRSTSSGREETDKSRPRPSRSPRKKHKRTCEKTKRSPSSTSSSSWTSSSGDKEAKKRKKKLKRSRSSSTSSSSSAPSPKKKKKQQKEANKKLKRKKKKKEKKAKKGQKKLVEKDSVSLQSPQTCLQTWQSDEAQQHGPDMTDEQKARLQTRRPMTKEEYEARQSIIRRVLDPETGRTRLIRGDGEVLEEIVSKERHKEINKATRGDADAFQKRLGISR